MKKPFLIGLTGSIGMGKSTTAKMFADAGAFVWDADAAVHRLYSENGAAVEPIAALCPAAKTDSGIDRVALKAWIKEDASALMQIEAIVHPLVAADRADFIENSVADIIVLDIPLLFETGSQNAFDLVAVVSAPADVQRERVLARPNMTDEQFEIILSKQMPDAQKRALADIVIDSSSMETAIAGVQEVMELAEQDNQNA